MSYGHMATAIVMSYGSTIPFVLNGIVSGFQVKTLPL